MYVRSSVRMSRNVPWIKAGHRSANLFTYTHVDNVSSIANFHPIRQRPSSLFSRSKIWIEHIGKFVHGYLANGDEKDKLYIYQHMWSRMGPFNWNIHVWPWPILKFKVMLIWTVNISQMVTATSNIANKLKVAYGLFICYIYVWPYKEICLLTVPILIL